MIKTLRLAWYWLRSRYAPQNTYVRCSTCPHWIFHSKRAGVILTEFETGICALDVPKVFNDFTTGYAFKAWTGRDWCPRHPLYHPKIVQGSDLEYRPGENATLGTAGFDRLPTFQEAVAMALKNPKVDAITEHSVNDNDSDNHSH